MVGICVFMSFGDAETKTTCRLILSFLERAFEEFLHIVLDHQC
jgi:hypothetical protein